MNGRLIFATTGADALGRGPVRTSTGNDLARFRNTIKAPEIITSTGTKLRDMLDFQYCTCIF